MGSSISVFPTELVDCELEKKSSETATSRDARKEYACTDDPKLRWPMTISHLLIMVAIFMIAFIVYSVYLRLLDRRLANKLKNTPSRLLPVGRDVVSHRVQRDIFDGFSSVLQDYSPADVVGGGTQTGYQRNSHGRNDLAYYSKYGGNQDGSGGNGQHRGDVEGILASLLGDARLME